MRNGEKKMANANTIYNEFERAAISRINNNCYTPPDRETSSSENKQVVPRHCYKDLTLIYERQSILL